VTPSSAVPGLDTPARVAGTVLVVAAAEVVMVWRFGWTAPLAAYTYFAVTGALVSAADLADRRVPNQIVLPAYPITAGLLAFASVSGSWWPLARAGIAAAVLGGFYLILGLAFPAGMGLGDVKWAGVIGAFLGWLDWSAVPTGTLIAFLGAAVTVVAARIAGRRLASLPMAPFMTLGALVAVVVSR
jgi:leader peptidase (prepilin peptidase) / N-methyltransferase